MCEISIWLSRKTQLGGETQAVSKISFWRWSLGLNTFQEGLWPTSLYSNSLNPVVFLAATWLQQQIFKRIEIWRLFLCLVLAMVVERLEGKKIFSGQACFTHITS